MRLGCGRPGGRKETENMSSEEKFIFFYSEHGVDSGRGMLKVYPRGREGFNPTQHCPTYIYFPWKRSKETNEQRLKKAKKKGGGGLHHK